MAKKKSNSRIEKDASNPEEKEHERPKESGPTRTSSRFSSASDVADKREANSVGSPHDSEIHQNAQQIVLEEFTPRYCVVNDDGILVGTSNGLERYLEFPDGSVQSSILRMAKRGLRSALSATFKEAQKGLRTVVRSDILMQTEGSGRIRLKLIIQPMPDLGENSNLFLVVFEELEESISRGSTADTANVGGAESMVGKLEAELEQTRAQLEDSIHDVEEFNEELRSSNEELRTINEELQSTNEELELSKEEIRAGMEALARTKSDLQNLLDGTQIATIFLDDELCIRGFTPAISKIYRLAEDDIGKPIDRFDPEVEGMPPYPDPGTIDSSVTDTIVAKTGATYIRRVLPYWTQDRSREGVVVTFADISELKERESKLADAAERLQLAAHAAKFASYDIDLINDSIVWTPELADILGQSMESLAKAKASKMVEFLHEEDQPGWQTAFNESHQIDGEGKIECEFRINKPDGTARWVLGRGETFFAESHGEQVAVRAVGVLMDVDDRKQTELRLAKSESERDQTAKRLSMALRSGGLAAWEWSPDGSVWTDELFELLGIDSDRKACPETFFECVHPADRDQLEADWKMATEGDRPYRSSFRLIDSNGQIRWLEGVGEIVRDESGNVVKVYGLNWDSTDEHRYQEALEVSKQLAQQASVAKTEFLANMSHEIRTPMSAIMGYADILAQYLKDPDNLNCVQIIQQNGQFLLEIINDILDISKIEAGKLELLAMPFRIDRLLADVKSLMEVRTEEKDVGFSIEVIGKIPQEITSDSKRLKQILFNLVGNAIKFTEVGSVKLTVSLVDAEGNDTAETGPKLKFEIEDSGIGISAAQLDRLFKPFMQGDPSVDRKFGGTGLGLAISRRLAEMLGGHVTVTSELGVGSIFSFSISTGSLEGVKMIDSHEFEVAGVTSQDDGPAKRLTLEGKILVVDDRREIRFIAQHFIADAGGQVITGENGQQAIDLIAEADKAGKPFDLLVIDMQMPVLDGYEATRQLRLAGFSKPIIALTAHAMEGDRNKCLEAGCTDYFAKPLEGPKFIKLLVRHLKSETASEVQHVDRVPNQGEASAPEKGPGKFKILLVDDNRNACEAVGVLLELNGHEIIHAYDGKSAIQHATSELPDFVLLDLGLPDIKGEDVARAFKMIPPLCNTFVIAMTGREDSPELRAAGFDDYIQKPINVNDVEELLNRLTNRQ